MDHAQNFLGFIDDDYARDFALFHLVEGFAGEDVRADSLRVARHRLAGRHFQRCTAMLFHQTAQVTVCEDSGEAAVRFENGRHAETLAAHLVNHLGHWCVCRDARKSVPSVHFIFDAQKFGTEAASGMQFGKVLRLKSAPFEERNGQRIADGHGNGGARSWSEVQRAGFFAHADVKNDIAGPREGGLEIACQRDERSFETFERFEELDNLFGFAAVGNGQNCVAAG